MQEALIKCMHTGLKNPAFVRLDADTKLSPDLGLCFACVRSAWRPPVFPLHHNKSVLQLNHIHTLMSSLC